MMLGDLVSAKSEHPGLTNREIIFEDFQHNVITILNIRDRRTDGRTDDLS